MKKYLLLFILGIATLSLQAQSSFSDDFESYNTGDFLGTSSDNWTTWGDSPGSNEDVKITDELAASGSKSIKFRATAAAGGPQDVVGYFGGQKITSGMLTLSMNMNVPAGKAGYFNLQGEVDPGETWSLNVTLENGLVNIANASNTTVMSGSFAHDEWTNILIEINLDINSWKTTINGNCLGAYANPNNFVASIDFFPIANGEFFIDDYSYDYTPEASTPTFDAGLSNVSLAVRGIKDQLVPIRGHVINFGTDVITSFDIEVEANGTTTTTNFTDEAIESNGDFAFELEEKYKVVGGQNDVTVRILNVNGMANDEEECNNAISASFPGTIPSPGKKVIVEEATGTWCGFCPRGAVAMERFNLTYPDHFIGIAIHGGSTSEPMLFQEYDDGLNAPGYPNSKVNRGAFVDPGSADGQFFEQLVVTPRATMSHGATYDEVTRQLELSIELTPSVALSGTGWRFNAVLTEDGVMGTTSAYNQRNYFSNDADLIDIHGVNYRDLPDPILAANITYEHVARATMNGFDGVAFDGGSLTVGESKIFNFSYTIPEGYNFENMNLVSMLIQPGGRINNGEIATLTDAVDNGYVLSTEYSGELTSLTNVFPNPVTDYTTVDIDLNESSDVSIAIIDLKGTVISSTSYGLVSGAQELRVDTHNLPSGMYTLKITANNKYTVQRIVKN